MKTGIKSATAGVLFTVLMAGAAFAADCCCKAELCKMECCDKDKAGKTTAPAEEHKH